MKRVILILAIAIVAACGAIPDAGEGVIALKLFPPDSLFIYVDSTIKLRAVALDIHGDSVPAVIRWQTPDTAFISLDSISGVMIGKAPGLARVQASAGTLQSDASLAFTVRADTTLASVRQRP